eukprot:Skav232639  [mRNA]  locus=scaffold12:242634:260553:+ [translate_table: standard]
MLDDDVFTGSVKVLLIVRAFRPPDAEQDQAMISAARDNKSIKLKKLLESPRDPAVKDEEGNAPLHHAARNGHLKPAELLLEAGAQKDARGSLGMTPLHYASTCFAPCRDHFEVVRLLIEAGAETNLTDQRGQAALHFAAHEGHLQVVRLLIEAGAETNLTDQRGQAALHLAACRGHLEVVSLLIEADAETNLTDQRGQAALHFAAHEGHLQVVRLLIEAGADKDLANQYGQVALHLAACRGHLEVVRLLIEADAETNLTDQRGQAALHFAAHEGHLEVVGLLIEADAETNLTDQHGQAALHLAACGGHFEVVCLLIEAGAETNRTDQRGQAALHFAAHEDHFRVVRLLIEAGAETNLTDQRRQAALHLAACRGHLEVVRLLIEANAETNLTDQCGQAALHFAAHEGHLEVVALLIADGAETNLADQHGLAALHCAVDKGHFEVVRLLIEAGVEKNLRNQNGQAALHLAACPLGAFKRIKKRPIDTGEERKPHWGRCVIYFVSGLIMEGLVLVVFVIFHNFHAVFIGQLLATILWAMAVRNYAPRLLGKAFWCTFVFFILLTDFGGLPLHFELSPWAPGPGYPVCKAYWGFPGNTRVNSLSILDLAVLAFASSMWDERAIRRGLGNMLNGTILEDYQLLEVSSPDSIRSPWVRLVKSEVGNALFGNKEIWRRLEQAAARHKKEAMEKGEVLVMTGHSLGGALVGAVSSRVDVDGVGFSPPGLYYQILKYHVELQKLYDSFTIIQPSNDVVPRVDKQRGMIEWIECSENPATCHRLTHTACELWVKCGDERKRDWREVCSAWYSKGPLAALMEESNHPWKPWQSTTLVV